jgi:Tol biopolymer transport system component
MARTPAAQTEGTTSNRKAFFILHLEDCMLPPSGGQRRLYSAQGPSLRRSSTAAALLLALALPGCRPADDPSPSPSIAPGCGPYPHRVTTLKSSGGRVDWSRSNNLIAYDRAGANGDFQVYTMAADGTRDACLTCGKPGLPQKNNGNPAWHPSGNYIVFQSEVADSTATRFAANPGRGVDNVLWVTDASGGSFTQLTELSSDPATGVLHPHFSTDGTRLVWSELYEGIPLPTGTFVGRWRLVVADFVIAAGRPSLRNVRRYEPGRGGFFETHGFSPDGSRVLFTSNLEQTGLESLGDIFLMDLGSLVVTRLTDENYNEHAHFFPSGRKIVWMTSAGNANRGTDLWIMNPDGSGKERLTFLNQGGCAEYAGGRALAADNSPNGAGDKIVVYVQDELLTDRGSIMLVELDRSF